MRWTLTFLVGYDKTPYSLGLNAKDFYEASSRARVALELSGYESSNVTILGLTNEQLE